MTDGSHTSGEHSIIYRVVEPLCCTPETNFNTVSAIKKQSKTVTLIQNKTKHMKKTKSKIHKQYTLSTSERIPKQELDLDLLSGSCWIGILKNWCGRRWEIVAFEHILKILLGRKPSPIHPAAGRERAELWVPYRGIFASIVVEDPVPTWMSLGPASNIVDLATYHQPLTGLLMVFLDLLPAVHLEDFSGGVTFPICLLLYRVLTSPICCWFPIHLTVLT